MSSTEWYDISNNTFPIFSKMGIRMVHVKNYETLSKFFELHRENCRHYVYNDS